ncbi:MAG: MtrB/PioB family outer membrane beta-barrel protein, partial [Parahaliea sp.]
TYRTLRFAAIAATALASALTAAQDSGIGVDLHFGNALQPDGRWTRCNPKGMTLFTREDERTPSGLLYPCPPDLGEFRPIGEDGGDWTFNGSVSLGYIDINDENNINWLRFNNWDDGVIFGADLRFQRPKDGSYAEFRASHINEDNQYFRVNTGRAGDFRIEAFARSQVNVTADTARSIWNRVGSDNLSLKPGLTPGGSTIPEVAALSASLPGRVLKVVRDKDGVGFNYYIDRQFTAFANISHEEREGARPFGGAFFFAYIFPGSGGVYETPRPIDDNTLNLNGGLRYASRTWNWDVAYSGSFFRNGMQSFSYEVPFAFAPLVPGFANYPLTSGGFAYEPENDYHNLRGSLSRKLPYNSQFALAASFSSSRQDDRLEAPINCSGQFGLTTAPFAFDCANWNSTAALSRKRADLRIDSTLVNAKLVTQASRTLTLRGNLKYHRQDYKGTYYAYNPLTGQYGYIAENGAQGSSVPLEMGVWDSELFPGVLTRVRNLPLDKEISEASLAADWRVSMRNTLGAALSYTRTERSSREVDRQEDTLLKLSWTNRAIDDLTLRLNYSYLDRKGRDYNYDPYEFTFSTSLPGFVDPGNLPPHTVFALRKYDVGGNEQHKVTLIGTYAATATTSLSATRRGDWNDYDAELGRRGYDTWGGSLQWDWMPSELTSADLFVGYDNTTLDLANVNEVAGIGSDPVLGGSSYLEENRWWVEDEQRNYYAGLNIRQRIGRSHLEFSWNYSDSRGDTDYRFNSPGALAYPALVADAGSGMPAMLYRVNTYTLSWSIPLSERLEIRLFDTYETGRLSDWHYSGLEQGLVTNNRVYLDSGPRDYSVNMIGAMVQLEL